VRRLRAAAAVTAAAAAVVVALGGHALFHAGGGSGGSGGKKQAGAGAAPTVTPPPGGRAEPAGGGEHAEDVRISRCGAVSGHTYEGMVVVTNHAAVTSNYVIVVAFDDPEAGRQADSAFVAVDGVAAGQVSSAHPVTGLKQARPGYSCRVSEATRYPTP
jgi:hypothetical protein